MFSSLTLPCFLIGVRVEYHVWPRFKIVVFHDQGFPFLPISPQGFAISVWGISHGRTSTLHDFLQWIPLIFLEIPSHSAKMVLSVERIRKKLIQCRWLSVVRKGRKCPEKDKRIGKKDPCLYFQHLGCSGYVGQKCGPENILRTHVVNLLFPIGAHQRYVGFFYSWKMEGNPKKTTSDMEELDFWAHDFYER